MLSPKSTTTLTEFDRLRLAKMRTVSSPGTSPSNTATLSDVGSKVPIQSETPRATIMSDNATVRWSLHSSPVIPDDQGCVRSSLPIPTNVEYFVFEVTILSLPAISSPATDAGDFLIGFANFDGNGRRKPELAPSYTYSTKTGQVKANLKTAKHVPAEVGDVIACGVSFMGHSTDPFVFFARNGEIFEPFSDWKPPSASTIASGAQLFAFVSFTSNAVSPSSGQGQSHSRTLSPIVRMNLDPQLFETDWSARLQEIETERGALRMERFNFDDDALCEKIVRDFLKKHGYVEALRAMDNEEEQEGAQARSSCLEEAHSTCADESSNHQGDKQKGMTKTKRGLEELAQNNKTHNNHNDERNSGGNGYGGGLQKTKRHQVEPSNGSNGHNDVEMTAQDDAQCDEELQFANERRRIRKLVLEGRIVEAADLVAHKWPDVIDSSIGLELRIHSLAELVLGGKHLEGIHYARRELWKYLDATLHSSDFGAKSEDEELQFTQAIAARSLVIQAMSIFAYPNPREALATSPKLAAVFASEKRRQFADKLNRALLFHPKAPQEPVLDKVLARMAECAATLKEHAGGYGAEFHLE